MIVRREDAERFIEEVRGREPGLRATYGSRSASCRPPVPQVPAISSPASLSGQPLLELPTGDLRRRRCLRQPGADDHGAVVCECRARDHRCHEGAGSSGTRAKAPLGSSTSRRSLGVSRTSNWSISLSDRELGRSSVRVKRVWFEADCLGSA
jgi:hypothetical protein